MSSSSAELLLADRPAGQTRDEDVEIEVLGLELEPGADEDAGTMPVETVICSALLSTLGAGRGDGARETEGVTNGEDVTERGRMLFGSRGSGWRLEAAGRSGGVRSIGWATGVVSCSLTSGAGEDEGSPCFVQPFILQSEAVLFFGASRGWWSSDAARDFGEETEWRLRVMPMWPFSLVGVRGVYASVEVECEKERSGSLIERAWRTGGSGGLVAGAFEAAWKGIAGEPRPGGRRACKKHRSQIRSRARREGSAAILPCVRCDRCFLAPRVRPLRPRPTLPRTDRCPPRQRAPCTCRSPRPAPYALFTAQNFASFSHRACDLIASNLSS